MACSASATCPFSYWISSKKNAHCHKAQPETCLCQRPGVQHHHGPTGQQPHLGPGPAASAQLQQPHDGQHGHGALCGHAPAAEQRVGRGQQHTRHQRGGLRWHRQAQPGRSPPQRPHHQRGQPGKQRDVETRNAHEVGHPGGAEHIPVRTVDGTLVAGDQRRHHARRARAGGVGDVIARAILPEYQALQDGVPHTLAQLLHRVLPGGGHTHRRLVLGARAHVTSGLQALLPHPQFVVKAMRVAQAMGRLQAHGDLPPLARTHRGGLALQVQHLARTAKSAAMPGHIHQGRQGHRSALQRRPLHHHAPAGARLVDLRHGSHHAGDAQVLALQSCRQCLRLVGHGPQAGATRHGQRPRQQHQPGRHGDHTASPA